MSLLISQDDEVDGHLTLHFHTYPLKRILTSLGIFQSNYHFFQNNQSFLVHRLLDINHKYKFRLDVKAQKDKLIFSSLLFKNSHIFVIRDTHTKVIYYRFVQKYLTKNSLTFYLTTCGNFATKKIFFYSHIGSTLSYSLRKQQDELIKSTLFEFIQQSALFYKTLIPKLQGNIIEISRLRQNYAKRQFLATNLCNYSCFPTFQMYRKEMQGSCQNLNLYSRYVIESTQSSHMQISKSQQLENSLYTTHIDLNNLCLPSEQQFNIQQIYNRILQHQQKSRQKMVQSEINNPQLQLHLLYKTFVTNLDIVYAKKQSKENKIYNHIQIINPELLNWELFQLTALSQLKIAKIKYGYVQQKLNKQKQHITDSNNNSKPNHCPPSNHQQQYYQSAVILKHQPLKLLQNNQKPPHMSQQLKWEQTIIQECFKNSYCIYMTRFFVPIQPLKIFNHINSKNNDSQTAYIISQYIKRGTLHKWLYESGFTNSIFTKINVILYILYGVMFLHSKKVFHMDIKPQNILIDKNLVPKIADFGSAYNKEVYQKMKKQKIHYYLSFSIPYTAPQIFMRTHKPQINPKCDVFSLGLIIYEIFFNRCIFGDVNSNRLDRIFREVGVKLDEWEERKMKSDVKQYFEIPSQLLLRRIFLCPQEFQHQQSLIYPLLINLITRCLSCSQEKRPNVGMLVIAIKQIFQMVVQYYAW